MKDKIKSRKMELGCTKINVVTIISVLALIISMAVGIFTLVREHAEDIYFKREELRKIIMDLVDLGKEYDKLVALKEKPEELEQERSFLSSKEYVYLSAAENIISKIPSHVHRIEYNIIGDLFYDYGEDTKAEYYHMQAVNFSDDIRDKALALASLGAFYFRTSALCNFEKGRKLYNEAAELIKNPIRAFWIVIKGELFEEWGDLEAQNGFDAEAIQKFNLARKYFSDLDPQQPLRQISLERLNNKINQIKQTLNDEAKNQY